jgi:rhodanese-related sulfurtransferase
VKHSPGFLQIVDDAKSRIQEVDIHQVKEWLDSDKKFCLIDVREESEWAASRLPCSIHIGKGIIECDIEHTIHGKDTTLVLYCGGGYRSALAAESLQKMGYTNVASMASGWRGWTEAGYEVADDQAINPAYGPGQRGTFTRSAIRLNKSSLTSLFSSLSVRLKVRTWPDFPVGSSTTSIAPTTLFSILGGS